jgi:hypothetical protein
MFSRKTLAAAAAVALLLLAGSPASAQEFRGSIVGTITDTTGGVLPGVTVTVSNTETRVEQIVVTDSQGLFQVLLLNPGTYSVTAELQGFKKVIRTAQIRVADVTRVDLLMETGGVTETVEVTATAPLLNTNSGISGTTVDSKQIAELPLGDGTAYMLTRLAPGIADSSDLHFSRPADNANLAGIVANGVQGGNEFTIDGAPNMSNARGVGFSPPSDAISEFKVQTNAFDAQTGHTAGAVVNLALKSGTNALRFNGSYFNRDDSRAETPLLTKLAGGHKPTRQYNRYATTLSGPVVRNKTFFMATFEHLRDVQPEPASYTVPTEKMRKGDLSEFTTVVYDPFTATGSNGTRTAFAGNMIPANRINPVAAAYLAYYPLPNQAGTVSNYFTNQLRPYDYNATMGRIDHNFNSANRLYATGYWNKRREDRYNWAQDASNATDGGLINGFAVTKGYDFRTNLGVTSGYTSTFSPTMVMDLRVSGARFGEYRDPVGQFDPASLGFSSTAAQLMGNYRYLPLFTFGSFSTTNSNSTIASLGAQRSDWGSGFNRPMDTYSVQPTVTRIYGSHTARAGYDFRYQRWTIQNDGFPAGRYQFNGAYTRANNSAALNDRAQSWAQFLLGLPTAATGAVATPGTASSQFEIASDGLFSQMYHGFFVQDDWKASRNLSVNLGLRLEVNSGMRESQNRNLAGFDFTTPNPIEAAAQAAYAAKPIAEIPVSSFRVLGGLRFADGPVNKTVSKLLPRGAVSYLLGERTVIRGGVGLFSYDYFFENINQAGFSQATPVLVTQDNGLTFTGANLTNPIPSGQLIAPAGSALGLASSLGQNLGTLYQPDRKAPYYTRWEASVQRDFGSGWVVAVTYLGSRGTDLPVARQINGIPLQYVSASRSRDTANESFLSQNVTNPFAGLLAGSTLNGSSIARSQLLRPFPEFGTFAVEEYTGSDRYHAGTVQVQKQFRSGNSLTAQYTRSRLRDKLNFLNPMDGVLEDRVSPNDRPDRLSIGTSLRLPFGRQQKWGSAWNALADSLLGGWQLTGTYQYQTGTPLTFGNLYYDGSRNPSELVSNIGKKTDKGIAGIDYPAWDITGFYFHDAAVQTNGAEDPAKQRADQRIQMGNGFRYFPSTLANVRNDNIHLMDIGLFKNVSMGHMRLQIRVEAINALNYTVLWNPNVDPRNSTFGYINTDRNSPRDIQLGLKFTF